MTDFKLPELGENIGSGDVVNVLVSVGDRISVDQPVLELETEKATLEVPSPLDGIVREIHVKPGDQAKVGSTVLVIEPVAGDQDSSQDGDSKAKKANGRSEEGPAPAAATSSRVLADDDEPSGTLPPPTPLPPPSARPVAPAAPAVRRFAREIGIDINQVGGSGPDGRISTDDVKRVSREKNSTMRSNDTAKTTRAALPDFSKFGEIERQPMNTIRRKTAEHLVHAWSTIPHVTHTDKADLTELTELRKRLERRAKASGGKITITAMLLKVIVAALKIYPQFNASLDGEQNEIILKRYYHIGVAVDTDRGLLVPVIRDVDRKSVYDLSVELMQLAEKARQRKLQIAEMQGRSFTISNVGGIGGIYFTPIINEPDVAILGIGRGSVEPVFSNGQFHPRLMLPLSLSYDHRAIDGADAARFTRWLAEAIEDPFLIAMAE